MGNEIRTTDLCNLDKWTTEEIKKYQQKKTDKLTSFYFKEGLPSDQPWHRVYSLNLKVYMDKILEENILKIMKEQGKPEALIALEKAVLEIY